MHQMMVSGSPSSSSGSLPVFRVGALTSTISIQPPWPLSPSALRGKSINSTHRQSCQGRPGPVLRQSANLLLPVLTCEISPPHYFQFRLREDGGAIRAARARRVMAAVPVEVVLSLNLSPCTTPGHRAFALF